MLDIGVHGVPLGNKFQQGHAPQSEQTHPSRSKVQKQFM